MATMIPSSEKVIFNNKLEEVFYKFFQDNEKTKDWTVFYSYRKNYRFGDVDFIVAIPNHGLMALELKNNNPTKISHDQFIYEYRGATRTTPNPFNKLQYQAIQIKDFLRQNRECYGTFVGHLLMFPNYNKEIPQDICKRREFYLNAAYFSNGMPTDELPDYLMNLFVTQRKNISCISPENVNESLRKAVELFKPVFSINESQTAEQIKEAISVLDNDVNIQYKMIKDLPRVFISGAAGTGKTYMAFQRIRDARAAGLKTLFLCFNKFLGEHIKDSFRMCPDVKACCIEEYMLKAVTKDSVKFTKDDKEKVYFYRDTLPKAFLKIPEHKKYDLLIVDEFQDLMNREYMSVLDCSVKGGLKAGNVWLLSDFEKNIFNLTPNNSADAFLKEYNFENCKINLCINYRNPSSITQLAENLVGTDRPLYERNAIRANGSADEIIIYHSPEDQYEKLEDLIEKLLSKECGHKRKDIVILSTHSSKNSDIFKYVQTNRGWGRYIKSPDEATDNNIKFTSVHRFKGLEANVVIVTDIDNFRPFTPNIETLLYTAVTRAKYKVIFMVKDATENYFNSAYIEKSE